MYLSELSIVELKDLKKKTTSKAQLRTINMFIADLENDDLY